MSDYKHTFDPETSEGFETSKGTWWRPAIALPYFVGWGLKRSRCGCGRVFRNLEDFRAHYVYRALWENESGFADSLAERKRR